MNSIQKLYRIITQPKRIVITMHKRPDGDAVGSALALAELCKIYGHHITIISPNAYPQFLAWMPAIQDVFIADNTPMRNLKSSIKKADVIFCMDFGEYHRLGPIASYVEKSNAFKVVIDHHPTEKIVGDLTFCDIQMPATAQLLYKLCVAMGITDQLNKNIAICLYVGILTDTGCFMNSNTTSETHEVVAQLIPKGIDVGLINYQLQSNGTLSRLHFTANAILHRLVVSQKHGFAYFAIPREDIRTFHIKTGETGNLVRYALNLKGITLAVLVTEQKDAVHLSFRSFGDRPVNVFAITHFQGGGHKNAAGGISYLSLEETVKKLNTLLIQYASISKSPLS